MTEYLEMSAAVNELLAEDEILILCHKNPDGDTIGSAGALYWALRALGPRTSPICTWPKACPCTAALA